jgi:hypothetical protein
VSENVRKYYDRLAVFREGDPVSPGRHPDRRVASDDDVRQSKWSQGCPQKNWRKT